MSKRLQELEKPQVRRSFLIIGGAAIGAAVIGFILMNFVLGGDGGGTAAPPASSPSAQTQPTLAPLSDAKHEPLREGGRDPFIVGTGGSISAAGASLPATPAPEVTPTPAPVGQETVSVSNVKEASADVKVNDKVTKNATAGTKVSQDLTVHSIASGCVFFDQSPSNKRFRVCEGEKYVTG